MGSYTRAYASPDTAVRSRSGDGDEIAAPPSFWVGLPGADRLVAEFGRRAMHVPSGVSLPGVALRTGVVFWLLVCSVSFAAYSVDGLQPRGDLFNFIHGINLIFHEAGHWISGIFGRFIGVLGGSALEVLIPLACLAAFLGPHLDAFAAAMMLWWSGEAMLGLAPYINDASEQVLPLLGGVIGQDAPGYHDWHNLLGWTGLLAWDHTIALSVHWAGFAMMLGAIVWAGRLLVLQLAACQR